MIDQIAILPAIRREISGERVREYLAHLGVREVAGLDHIECWDGLQRFVSSHPVNRPSRKPNINVRLKTYSLHQEHPVRMLIKHVTS